MRKLIIILALVVLVAAAGSLLYASRAAKQPALTMEVDGQVIVLKPGENVAPEIYELAKENPEFVANSDWRLIDGRWEPLAKGVTVPVEVKQIILPDGHPEFPLDLAWVYAQDGDLPIEVPVPLRIPASWQGKVEVRVEGESVCYDHAADTALKQALFCITALTETGWQAIQSEPHGEALLAYGGVVWVYNPALENPYGGDHADEFQKMAGEAYEVAGSLAGFFTPGIPPEAEQAVAAARHTLTSALGLPESRISLVAVEPQDWSNSCLGMAGPDEACAEVVTPGWRMAWSAGGSQLRVHSDRAGANQRFDPPAAGVTIPVETGQIVLPDGHPEFPLDTVWVYAQTEDLPLEVPVPLRIPESWQGKVEARAEGEAVCYDYAADPALKQALFCISALTEAGWQSIQGKPHGEALFSYGGVVWVYNPALENPYSGSHADEFQRMVGEAYEVAGSLIEFFAPGLPADAARQALLTYLSALRAGRYAEATRFYGGDYDQLTAYNPEIDANSHAALLAAACTVNGFACHLEVVNIVQEVGLPGGAFRFTLELQNADGSPFELGACCGADGSDTALHAQFDYTVQPQDGRYWVLELPVYVP